MLAEPDFLRVIAVAPLISIDLVLRDTAGRILLGRRLNRPAQGCWFVPGGRIHKGERVPEALARISRGEVGLTLTSATLLGVFDHLYPDNFAGAPGLSTHYVVIAFDSAWPAGLEPAPDDQHEALRWWTVEALLASAEVHENTKAYFRPVAPGQVRVKPPQ